jgi:hypothetical protein
MNSIVTYIQRQPLVTKAKQIYATTDRQQPQQKFNTNNRSFIERDKTSRIANIDLYGYQYETIEHQSSMFDIKV